MLRWTAARDHFKLSTDGATVTHRRNGPDGAVAALLMESGRHVVALTIEQSDRDRGFMYLGVLAADEGLALDGRAVEPRAALGQAQAQAEAAVGWGFCPLNGHLHVVSSAAAWGEPRRKMIPGDLAGRATGSTVELHVDMDRRALSIAVNGEAPVEAQVALPAAVRPWVLLGHKRARADGCWTRALFPRPHPAAERRACARSRPLCQSLLPIPPTVARRGPRDTGGRRRCRGADALPRAGPGSIGGRGGGVAAPRAALDAA